MNNSNDVKNLLSEWLTGTIFASFEFSAGFTVCFERILASTSKPNVFYLEMRSLSSVGNKSDWHKFVDSLPCKTRRGEADLPALAYRLMLLVGTEVSDVELGEDGSISIATFDGETLYLSGTDDVWEESWILSESRELVGEDAKFITCDSDGNVYIT